MSGTLGSAQFDTIHLLHLSISQCVKIQRVLQLSLSVRCGIGIHHQTYADIALRIYQKYGIFVGVAASTASGEEPDEKGVFSFSDVVMLFFLFLKCSQSIISSSLFSGVAEESSVRAVIHQDRFFLCIINDVFLKSFWVNLPKGIELYTVFYSYLKQTQNKSAPILPSCWKYNRCNVYNGSLTLWMKTTLRKSLDYTFHLQLCNNGFSAFTWKQKQRMHRDVGQE